MSRGKTSRILVAGALAVAALTIGPLGNSLGASTYDEGSGHCSKAVHHASGRFRARLQAPGHNPKADQNWPIKVTVRSLSGRPLRGSIYYQFVFSGQVVSCRTVGAPGHPRFRGTFRDVIIWPQRSVGVPLTFRVVLRTSKGLRNLDYRVQVQA